MPKKSQSHNAVKRTPGTKPGAPKTTPPTKLLPQKHKKSFKPSLEALLIVLFSVALYANTLTHGFVLDDMMMITHNSYTREGFDGLGKILTHDAFTGFHGEDKNLLPGGRYRPLSQMMFAVGFSLFGENPFPGHLISVLLYALACLLTYKALRMLLESNPITVWKFSLPFFIAILFAVHPLHTESVANIKGRDDILSLIGFALLAILSLQYLKDRKRLNLWMMLPVFFLSMLAKESALTFLAAIPLLIIFKEQRFSKTLLPVMAALAGGLVLYLILRIGAIGFPRGNVSNPELLNNPFIQASFSERMATLFFTWIKYIGLILFPHPLTHDYYPWHITYKTFGNPAALLSVIFFVGGSVLALRKLRRPGMVSLGFLLFVILFSSQSNLLVNIGSFMNERFVFLALLGMLISLGWIVAVWLPEKTGGKYTLTLAIGLIMVLGFSVKTVSRNRAWKDDFTLFTTDVKVSANSAKVTISAGGVLLEKAQKATDKNVRDQYLSQALIYLRKGVELHPGYVQGQILLGNALLLSDDFGGALKAYESCLKMNRNMSDPLKNARALGQKALLKKDFVSAEAVFSAMLKYQPADQDFASGYAESMMNIGKQNQALVWLDSLVGLYPSDSRINHLLGQYWGRFKGSEPNLSPAVRASFLLKSKAYLVKAVDAEPDNYGMLENLAIVNGMMGDFPKALAIFNNALNLMLKDQQSVSQNPSSLEVLNGNLFKIYKNIGDTYRSMGDFRSMLANYEHAYTYNGNDPVVVSTLARLYVQQGNKGKGVELLKRYMQTHPGDQVMAGLLSQIQQ